MTSAERRVLCSGSNFDDRPAPADQLGHGLAAAHARFPATAGYRTATVALIADSPARRSATAVLNLRQPHAEGPDFHAFGSALALLRSVTAPATDDACGSGELLIAQRGIE